LKGRLILLMVLLSVPNMAAAGVYTDELAKCLVTKTSDQDRLVFVRWIVFAFSRHPGVADLARTDEGLGEEMAARMATVSQRLLLEDCHEETRLAIQYEGKQALKQSFQYLGQIAARTLNRSTEVQEEFGRLRQYLDEKRLQEAFGITE